MFTVTFNRESTSNVVVNVKRKIVKGNFAFDYFLCVFFEIMRIKVVNELCESCNFNVIKNVGGN